MSKGYCYVIINESCPEWCKVCFTRRKDSQRLREYQTYSPFTYELFHQEQFDDAHKAEMEIHRRLKQFSSKNKEWFKLSPRLAANIIDGVKQELDTWGEFEDVSRIF